MSKTVLKIPLARMLVERIEKIVISRSKDYAREGKGQI